MRYTFDIVAAPIEYSYNLVVTLDDFKSSDVLEGGTLVDIQGIAADRVISADESGCKFTVQLSATEEASVTLTVRAESAYESFRKGSKSWSVGLELGVGVTAVFFFGNEATYSTTLSTEHTVSVEQGTTWSSSSSRSRSKQQTRSVTIQDTLEADVPANTILRAQLIVTKRHLRGVTVMDTGTLYADGDLIATSRFPVTIDAVTVSSGDISVDAIASTNS